jgi:predicted membrane protein
MVIVAVGVIVGVLAGPWWGIGAALILLALNEVIERVQRSRA